MSDPKTPFDPAAEPDPTGMRALLRSLPEPGPMPADLTDRILASLAAEQTARTPTPAPHEAVSAPTDLAAFRHRKRRSPLLVAAAGIMAVAGVGVVAASGMPSALVAAISGQGHGSSSSNAAVQAEGAPDTASAPLSRSGEALSGASPSGADAQLASGTVALTASGTDWSTDSLAQAAPGLLAGAATIPPLAAESPGLGPVATQLGASDCATALGLDSSGGLAVDLGTHAGVPVAAVAARNGAGQITVVIAERSCGLEHHVVIDGPVTVP